MHFPVRLTLLLTLVLAEDSAALDSLIVGETGRLKWTAIKESSTKINIRRDSIWKWNVEANGNLSPGLFERGGRISITVREEDGFLTRLDVPPETLHAMFDGDPGTIFDPETIEDIDVPRDAILYLDLGDIFQVDRVRLHPRTDEVGSLKFPQIFNVFASDNEANWAPLSKWEEWPSYSGLLRFSATVPNRQTIVDRRFESRPMRYLSLQVNPRQPWEIAEFEIFSDGKIPLGEYLSRPMNPEFSLSRPLVWGQVRGDGGDIAEQAVVVQTRSGPDFNPTLYFRRTGVGDDLEPVAGRLAYLNLDAQEKGPMRPNPEWSGWENLVDGHVVSPVNPIMQFRLFLSEPGTSFHTLLFEYSKPPIALELAGEIAPARAIPAVETAFTLSLRMLFSKDRRQARNATGFRQLEVRTPAHIIAIDKVLVDDIPVSYTPIRQRGRGFTLWLPRRLEQDGTFLQIKFRAILYQDGTRFSVRALDRRRNEPVYQAALEADVDAELDGNTLVVRFDEPGKRLVVDVEASSIFTPNQDGVNDLWSLSYALLKLNRPTTVTIDLFDLAGRPLHRLFTGEETSGLQRHTWDGRDANGRLVPPGHYLYQLHLDADEGSEKHRGAIAVVY